MRVAAVEIILEPNELEVSNGKVTRVLKRGADKLWTCNGAGIFPHEAKLIVEIQHVVSEFNGGQ